MSEERTRRRLGREWDVEVFEMLWTDYALADDSELTAGARRLKYELLAIIGDRPSSPPEDGDFRSDVRELVDWAEVRAADDLSHEAQLTNSPDGLEEARRAVGLAAKVRHHLEARK